MRVIHKYTLQPTLRVSFLTLANASVRKIAEQHGELCVWMEGDDDRHHEEWTFHTIGTGRPVPDDLPFLGSALCEGGRLVWHVYGRPERPGRGPAAPV